MKAPSRVLACTVVTLMLIGTAVILGAGRGSAELTAPAKPVRAVSAMYLNRSCPVQTQTMTGSVASWKTEQVGFEVAGRVLQVLELGAEIEGRVLDQATGAVLSEGTVLARLDDQRYRITAEIAQAALDVAQRKLAAIQVEIEQSLPARLDAAQAEQRLAQGELARTQELVSRNAISRSEFDRVQTTLETATANVAIRKAELAAKQAEYNSAAAQVEQARLRLEEAERDREDTLLHAPFRGQVANVHVVAGSYVAVGAPVLTVQMMDPIQVEFELSATMSRKFRFGDAIRIFADGPDGSPVGVSGIVHRTDPVADADTRTFTVTLLVRNQKVHSSVESDTFEGALARTPDIWPLNVGPIVGGGTALLAEKHAIRHDAQGAFVWKVTNRENGDVTSHGSRILNVVKLRVTPGELQIPFLGNWEFVPIAIDDGATVDPDRDLIAGEIVIEGGNADAWSGDRILLDRSEWLLRPGDLVRVELPSLDAPSGHYVPMKAILHESDRTWVFVAEESSTGQFHARRLPIELGATVYAHGDDQVLRRILPSGGAALADGDRLIVEGVHFLTDGEPISVLERAEDDR